MGGHCEIQREPTTDLHNTPIKLYYVRQSEPHYWVVKCDHYEFTSPTSQHRAECRNSLTNVAIRGFSGCKLLQAHVHVKRRESCGRKFQSIHEMHIQHAGIELSKTWSLLSSPTIRRLVPRRGKVAARLAAAWTVSKKLFQCKLLGRTCPGGMYEVYRSQV